MKKGLAGLSFRSPSLIQKMSLEANESKRSIIGQSKNGTGKTLAFLLVLLSNISFKPEKQNVLQSIVISPSRELALQTHDLVVKLTAYASPPIKTIVTIGGQALSSDIKNIKLLSPQILVGSLGRVIHLVKEELISLENISVFVVDEADNLFIEKSFKFDMHGLIALTSKRMSNYCLFSNLYK